MKRVLVVLGGLIFVAIGIWIIKFEIDKTKRCTEETIGIVVKNIEKTEVEDNKIKYMYYPVIKYKANGKTITKTSNAGTGHERYSANEKVNILYNPKNIEEFIIKGDSTINFVGIVFVIVGGIFAIAGFIKKAEDFV